VIQSSRLRVLHVIDSLGMGGAETWLMELQKVTLVRGFANIFGGRR
jgi:hypothetical protein